MIRIRPAHHALLCYAEWCADNRRPWPGMKRVATDLARNKSDLECAFAQLKDWGLLSARYSGNGQTVIVRLGDGRETTPLVPDILVIHRHNEPELRSNIRTNDTRIAA